MRTIRRNFGTLILFAAILACTTHRTAESAPRIDRNVLTQTQMLEQHFENAYAAIEGVGHGAGVIYIETMASAARGKEPIDLSGGSVIENPGPVVVSAATSTANPRFDWFSYDGTEEAYHTIRPVADYYLNPILAGFYPDPSVVRARDDYYLVTSTRRVSSHSRTKSSTTSSASRA
jgi:hypothetical protein